MERELFPKSLIDWASENEHYGLHNLFRKLNAFISALYFMRDFPYLNRYRKDILRLCWRGIFGLNEDLRVYLSQDKTRLQIYFSYTSSMLYPLYFLEKAIESAEGEKEKVK